MYACHDRLVDTLKGLVGYVVLAVCILLAYQGYQTSANPDETEALSKASACAGDATCVVNAERPREIRTDAFARHYQWGTTTGSVDITCTRGFVFFGEWTCAVSSL